MSEDEIMRRALEEAVKADRGNDGVLDGPFSTEASPLLADLRALRQRVREATHDFEPKSQSAIIEATSQAWARDVSKQFLTAHKSTKNSPGGMSVSDALDALLDGAVMDVPSVALIDGHARGWGLFYPGHVNGAYGDGSVGKSVILAEIQARELNASGIVVHWEFDNNPVMTIIQRLLNAGAKPEAIRGRFHVIYTVDDRDSLTTDVRHAVKLVTLDAMNPAITALGCDPYHPSGVDTVIRECFQPFTLHGACGIFIDHVGHENKARQLGAIRKSQAVQGALYEAVRVSPLKPGLTGRTRLVLRKDNRGSLGVEGHDIAAAVMRSTVRAGDLAGAVETSFVQHDPASEWLAADEDPVDRIIRLADSYGLPDTAGRDAITAALKAHNEPPGSTDVRREAINRRRDRSSDPT
ncbi:hypothetical protein [Streptomyces sp. NPDC051665]|uniref:hypothetical protein n=1 Tax=Streptomyces sp. NPDC051665 TaxID=3154647 RepID=UPI00342DC989